MKTIPAKTVRTGFPDVRQIASASKLITTRPGVGRDPQRTFIGSIGQALAEDPVYLPRLSIH